MKKFSFATRTQNIEKMKVRDFDLLIIGGGITGAGVARDAALRGLRVALVEAKDFAYGTSSRSSKLIHGGIRYLENLEFKLVFEALTERSKLFSMAPHLVHPLRFMIPMYETSRVSMFKMGLGMLLYDGLALFSAPELHERLDARATKERMPIVNGQGLIGSYVYSDGYMDDDRLVHETLRSANEAGAVCANYVAVAGASYHDNKIETVTVKDTLTSESFQVRASHVVSTVGPWTDLVGQELVDDWKKILRPTKGIHLTFSKERLPLTSAVVMAAEKSSRIVFAIPRHEMVIVGTTDTDFNQKPDNVVVTPQDVEYLLKIANQYFPGAKLTAADILSSYAGVRPLVHDGSASVNKTSREHTILHDARGLTFVAGGKYTTYRKMSEEIVDQALKYFPIEVRASLRRCETAAPLNEDTSPENFAESLREASAYARHFEDRDHSLERLAQRYGMEYKEILRTYKNARSYWQLEAYQAINTTMCLNLTDFYCRRVPLFLSYEDHGLSLLPEISEVFQSTLQLTDQQMANQQRDLKNYMESELSWRAAFKATSL